MICEAITIHITGVGVIVVGENANSIAAIISPAELKRFAKSSEHGRIRAVGIITFTIESPCGAEPHSMECQFRAGYDCLAVS